MDNLRKGGYTMKEGEEHPTDAAVRVGPFCVHRGRSEVGGKMHSREPHLGQMTSNYLGLQA